MHTTGNRLVGRNHLLPVALLLLLACTPSYSSLLHDAAVNGDIVLLKQLLDSGKHDVNGQDASGRTPLAAALATCSEPLYCSAAALAPL
jgi:ankyrin repeat protein